jgi:hypothetical protein
MAIVIKPITVEVSKPNVFQAIAAKQNDSNSRFLRVTFVNEGEEITVPSNAEVTINAKRNDGQSNSFFGEINTDGTVTVPIHSWVLELPGYVNCDVSIIEADSKLTSTTFTLLVEEASHGSGDVSDEEQYDFLTEVVKMVAKSKNEVASAIPNTSSGTAVAITDISPLEHILRVKARSDTVDVSTAKLQRYEKNLYDNATIRDKQDITATGYQKYKIILPNGIYAWSLQENNFIGSNAYAVFTDDVAYSGGNTATGCFKSWIGHSSSSANCQLKDTFTVTKGYVYLARGGAGIEVTLPLLETMQIEVGTEATPFEPYKEPTPYPINPNGTVDGVTSVYPTTTLIPDTEGVVIDVEYNVDTKKYIDNKFAELAAMIVNS